MRGRTFVTACLVALLALVMGSEVAGAAKYNGFIGRFGEPTHKGEQGAGWTANFKENKKGRVAYRVCLRHRGNGTKKCWAKKTGKKGGSEIFVALFVNDQGGAGRWIARWFDEGRVVDKWKFRVVGH